MSLLDNASLVLTPNAYKEGKLYSAIPSNGNGDFTATRATTATKVNSAGLVDLVPYNLVTYSEQFDNVAWTKFNTTITANTTTAPDGALTADTLLETTANSEHAIFSSTINSVANQTYTHSTYVKYNGRDVRLSVFNSSFTNGFQAVFNIQTGSLIQSLVIGNGVYVSSSIVSVGNGWYRCSVTGYLPLDTSIRYLIYSSNGLIFSYIGDVTKGAFIWGAQLVEGTSSRDYLRTETRLNIPRVDYSLGGCPNILLEPQRTNIATFSDDFSNAIWQKFTGVSVNVNTSNSPSGTLTADTIIGATGAVAWTGVNTLGRSVSSLSSSTTYAFSVYLKGSGSVTTTLRDQTTGNLTSLVCNLTSSWQRFELTRTTGAATTALGIIFSNATGNFDIWGAQLEAGAYATSYIPTTTASVTRNADTLTRNNIFTNGLITAAGGTWFVELRNNRSLIRDSGSFSSFVGDLSSSPNNGLILRSTLTTSTRLSISKRISTTETTLYTTLTDTIKVALKWNGSTADVFVNGVKQVSATAFTTTNMEFLNCFASDVPRFINEMALFPTPLTDAQCLALTA